MLFSVIHDPLTTASELNHDLLVIQQWANQWKMVFNPDPAKQATEVLFSCKKNKVAHPPIAFNGIPVAKVEEQKHLGLILDGNLSLVKHINAKIVQAQKKILG